MDLTVSTALCLAPQSQICIGVKFNSSTSKYERILGLWNETINCIKNVNETEEKVFLKNGMIHQQSEMALIDLELGQLVPASIQGVAPMPIRPAISTRLQIQIGRNIMICNEKDVDCHLWIQSSDQWHILPSLSAVHKGATMNLVGNQAVVVAGRSSQIHGIVEIFDTRTQQWTLGPSLSPARRGHAAVTINGSSLAVLGGFGNESNLDSVKVLNLYDWNWTELSKLPTPLDIMVCGMVNMTYIVCVGGRSSDLVISTAYGLDLSVINSQWERTETFDVDEPIALGFILRLREHLFCMSQRTTGNQDLKTLRRMNLNGTTPTWEIMEKYPITSFDRVSPYVTDGFHIQVNNSPFK